MSDRSRVAAAARDNAEWCHAFCEAHGVVGVLGLDAWSSDRRTPDGYPDAVTLRPGLAADAVLALVDAGPGCSVKDSFADLDLAPSGFDVLLEASWIWHPAPAPRGPASAWREVTDEAGLVAWEAAWAAGPPSGVFRPGLLGRRGVRLLAEGADGAVRAGCVVTRGSAGVVGLSNVFDVDGGDPWPGILGWVAAHLPGRAVVGYERGADLAAARSAGFVPVGDLRVWLCQAPAADAGARPGDVRGGRTS